MRFISWNVNGLRACITKGFQEYFDLMNADFFCLQETKLQAGQVALELPGYEQFWNYAQKKGYSGTAVFTKEKPIAVTYGVGIEELDTEGRLITLEYPEFYLCELDRKKPVIACGDLNVAHQEIDLKNPASNRGNAGFSDEERESFGKLLDAGFTDTFRYRNPDVTGAYSWWSYRFNARKNNAGWRIDYFIVSNRLAEKIAAAPIYSEVMGSDHCPVGLELDI